MPINEELFGAKNEAEIEIFAVEDLIFDVQMLLQAQMTAKAVTQKELARRLDTSAARVSQLFSDDGGNMTLATLAKMAHALAMVARVELRPKEAKPRVAESVRQKAVLDFFAYRDGPDCDVWQDHSANQNVHPASQQLVA
ncbi:MAG: helix-turn-helix transcriptional regulator [Pseudomonadota bacterium]